MAEKTMATPAVVMAAAASTRRAARAPLAARLAQRLEVPFARRAAARGELHDLELRVAGERGEELLAGEARGPHDGDRKLDHENFLHGAIGRSSSQTLAHGGRLRHCS